PPYGAKIDKKELDSLKKKFKSNENINSVAIFMDFAMNYWLKKDGIVSMIVPKSLLYSEKWFSLVLNLINHTNLLVDVEKAFDKVKLEQVFYVSNFKKKIESYYARKFLNNNFLNSNNISTKVPLKLYSWICDITPIELEILNHILNNVNIEYMKNISDVKRGIGLQKLLKDTGEIEVIGGKQCQRYFKDGIRGYLSKEDLANNQKKIEFMQQKKLVSQDLVAHIQNPLPHIKLSTFFDEKGHIMGLDTIQNIVLNNNDYDYRYILGLLNSNFINWYTYKFIYSSAIRTMHFDKNYIGKIIIPNIKLDEQKKIIDCVKEIEINIGDFEIKRKLEEKLNNEVYKLFKLSKNQIETINKNFKAD
ncbi:MAG: TaqI-like C-terminal specificity domain-containing protein, partial [Fusobacteriaceae bacterium]